MAGPLGREARQLGARAVQAAFHLDELPLRRLGLAEGRAHLFIGRLDPGPLLAHAFQLGLGSLHCSPVLVLAGQLVVDLGDRCLPAVGLRARVLRGLFGQLLVPIICPKPQDIAQHALALGGTLDGELVRPALQQKGRIDERVIVHVQQVIDLALGGRDGRLAERTKTLFLAVPSLQLQAALPAPSRVALAQDPVTDLAVPGVRIGQRELELDLHLALPDVDQLVVAAGAQPRVPPQRPGQRVEDRRLAVAIVAGQAGQVDARESELLLAVAHKVAHIELVWDHCGKSAFISGWAKSSSGRGSSGTGSSGRAR